MSIHGALGWPRAVEIDATLVAMMTSNGNPPMWNGFDTGIELFLNRFAGRSAQFDIFVNWVGSNPLAKGGPILLPLWFCLFDRKRPGRLREGSEFLIGALVFSVLACIGARGLAILLPFRTRPLATPLLGFHLPIGAQMNFADWSSFPSDHAALYFALAAGILTVSRPAGWWAMAWAALGVSLPRLYLGEHWPTDILAGAVIGIVAIRLLAISAVQRPMGRQVLRWYENHAPLFLTVLMLWTCETMNLFGDVRHALRILVRSL